MIKAIIFDLNGVLITGKHVAKHIEEVYGIHERRVKKVYDAISSIVQMPDAPPAFSLWQSHLQTWGIRLSEQEFFRFWFSEEVSDAELFDLAQTLRREGIKLFILSKNFRERTTFYREKFSELFTLVDGAYFSWETGLKKPHQEAFFQVLKSNRLQPEECLFFDDKEDNVKAANQLGIHGIPHRSFAETKEFIRHHLPQSL